MTKRTGIMLAQPLTPERLAKMPGLVYEQPKLDGDRCRAVFTADGYKLFSSQGNDRSFAVPHIVNALNETSQEGARHTYDGELYIHGVSHQAIRSLVSRTTNRHPDCAKISYHAFDTISNYPQGIRLSDLFNASCGWMEHDCLEAVETTLIYPRMPAVVRCMDFYCDEGYEGVILRHPDGFYETKRSNNLLKLKPDKKATAKIVAPSRAFDIYGRPKDMVGSFIVANDEGITFKVGAGRLTHEERARLWCQRDNLEWSKMLCHYRYLRLTEAGIPREPICLKLERL